MVRGHFSEGLIILDCRRGIGTKKWITNGTFADYFTVGCKTEVRFSSPSVHFDRPFVHRMDLLSFLSSEA